MTDTESAYGPPVRRPHIVLGPECWDDTDEAVLNATGQERAQAAADALVKSVVFSPPPPATATCVVDPRTGDPT